MHNHFGNLSSLRRPRLLVRAARIGAEEFHRNIHLPRLLGHSDLSDGVKILDQLSGLERDIEQSRTEGELSYSISQHVDVLTALLAELSFQQIKEKGLHQTAQPEMV